MPVKITVDRLSDEFCFSPKYSNDTIKVGPRAASKRQMFVAWSVMTKTIVGVGLLGLGAATASFGWILSLTLFTCAGLGAIFTLHLLNILSVESGAQHVSFYMLAERVAPYSRWLVDVAITVKCVGVGSGYLLVGSTQILRVIRAWAPGIADWGLGDRELRCLLIVFFILLLSPVTFRRCLKSTQMVNILGLVAIAYVVLLSIVYAGKADELAETSLWPKSSFVEMMTKIPIFIFTFTCHQNMFLVADSFGSGRRLRDLDLVAVACEVTGLIFFIPALICPYLLYGSSVSTDYVKSMPSGDLAVQVGRLLLGIAEVCAFPLQLFPCRKSIHVMIYNAACVKPLAKPGSSAGGNLEAAGAGSSTAVSSSVTPESNIHVTNISHVAVTCCILVLSALIACLVDDLGDIFKVVGIIGSNTICYIMPCFLFCKSFANTASVLGLRKTAVPAEFLVEGKSAEANQTSSSVHRSMSDPSSVNDFEMHISEYEGEGVSEEERKARRAAASEQQVRFRLEAAKTAVAKYARLWKISAFICCVSAAATPTIITCFLLMKTGAAK